MLKHSIIVFYFVASAMCIFQNKSMDRTGLYKVVNQSNAGEEDYSELDAFTNEKEDVGFSEIFAAVEKGDYDDLADKVGIMLYNNFIYEIKESFDLFVGLIVIASLGSMASMLSGKMSFFVGGNGFFVTYIIMCAMLLSCFSMVSQVASDTIGRITEFMMTFIATYSMATAYSTGTGTALFTREMIVITVFLCEGVLLKVVFPMVKCSGICGLLNRMNNEDYFSKLSELLASVSRKIVRLMFGAITGLNIVKGIIMPSVDQAGRNSVIKIMNTFTRGSAAIIAGMVASSGVYIRNCIGVAGMIVLFVIALMPLVKICVVYMGLRLVAALVQPLGERRFSDGITVLTKSIEIIMKAVTVSIFMFVVTIVAVATYAHG